MDLEAKEPLGSFRNREDFVCEAKKVEKLLELQNYGGIQCVSLFVQVLVELLGVWTGDMLTVARSETCVTAVLLSTG